MVGTAQTDPFRRSSHIVGFGCRNTPPSRGLWRVPPENSAGAHCFLLLRTFKAND
jgi:hypothetical protein